DDILSGGAGDDSLFGGAGDDVVDGGDGNDSLQGDAGNDTLIGGDGNDTMFGGTGDDLIQSASGNNLVSGDEGNDTIQTGSGADTLHGGTGNDVITGGAGADVIGGDTIAFDPSQHVSDFTGAAKSFTVENSSSQSITLMWIDADGALVPYATIAPGDSHLQDTFGYHNWVLVDSASGDARQLLGSPEPGAMITHTDGDDDLSGDAGDDTLTGGGGNDSLFGGDDNDALYGGTGNDSLTGGAGDDVVYGGPGNDTLVAGPGDDLLMGGDGDDTFQVANGFGNDTVVGGETGETNQDWIDARLMTGDATLIYSGDDAGVLSDGTSTMTFSEIERFGLGTGNDLVDGRAATTGIRVHAGTGDDTMLGGDGEDSFIGGIGSDLLDGGRGNDFIDLGTSYLFGDQAADTVVMRDGYGNKTLSNFEAPTDAGGGVWTGLDQLDVSGLTDAEGNPVNVLDVTVTDDGFGNALLTFPNGESVRLNGVAVSSVSSPAQLVAMGIPPAPDGIVDGSIGNDVMGSGFSDAQGDQIDGTDGDNDTIHGYGGNDSISAGAGDDSVLGGDGADSLFGGSGNDTLDGGAGDDSLQGDAGDDTLLGGTGSDKITLSDGFGTDSIAGGEDAGGTDTDTLDASGVSSDLTVTYNGAESGTLNDGVNGATFEEIEHLVLGSGNDTVSANSGGGSLRVSGGDGTDALTIGGAALLPSDVTGISDTATGIFTPSNGDAPINFGPGEALTLSEVLATYGKGSYSVNGSSLSGTVGEVKFDGFEKVAFTVSPNVACFTHGTRIQTDRGEVAIQDLVPGDLVLTLDNGYQPLRWIGSTTRSAVGALAPILIRAGALGNDHDLRVSPQHRMLLRGWQAALLFAETEVLVTAKSLVNDLTILRQEGGLVTYVHILFDRHEIVFAEGAASESFHPGEQVWAALDQDTRNEVLDLFPHLLAYGLSAYGPTARLSLRDYEARALSGMMVHE
ncbi:MAG: Hint domain-containing protein, partial [Gemmobacter sp.]|nr:Hint domain-containing protein [Gemmobacter sp.]